MRDSDDLPTVRSSGALQAKAGQGERVEGASKAQLTLLYDISGAFRPGRLTCLMGVSGAGKTTLMDVLAGRKTGAHHPADFPSCCLAPVCPSAERG